MGNIKNQFTKKMTILETVNTFIDTGKIQTTKLDEVKVIKAVGTLAVAVVTSGEILAATKENNNLKNTKISEAKLKEIDKNNNER